MKQNLLNLYQVSYSTPCGPLYAILNDEALWSLSWRKSNDFPLVNKITPLIKKVRVLLQHFFKGQDVIWDLPLVPRGTAFQRKVWETLQTIPWGQTRTYKDIACILNKPKSFRAIGQANGANPWCVLYPCHRIVSSDGSIGGYNGGVAVKAKLLRWEKQICLNSQYSKS